MKRIKATYGQTMIDIALQEYGCYEGLFLLIADNSIALGEDLVPGQTLLIRDEVPELTTTNRAVVEDYKKHVEAGNASGRKINSGIIKNNEDGDYDHTDYEPIDYL